MADLKISELTNLTAADPANDMIPIVDVSATPPASGSTKRISINNILACSPTATLASATISGNLTLSAGTANGVGYLNASKVLTAGSALIFDGTNLGIGGTGQLRFATSGGAIGDNYIGTENSFSMKLHCGRGSTSSIEIASDKLLFYTSASERYRIASDGVATWSNVGGVAGTAMTLNANGLGIGVTPSAWGNAYKVVQTGQALGVYGRSNLGYYGTKFNLYNDNTNDVAITTNYVGEYRFELLNGSHVWLNKSSAGTAGVNQTLTQAMTLDASGNLLVGTTTANGRVAVDTDLTTYNGMSVKNTGTAYGSSAFFFRFINSSGATAGSIQHTAVTTTNYSTTSDARLKESKGISTDTSVIDNTVVHDFVWKADGSTDRGVFAQEAHAVKPRAVSVGSDELTEDGNIKTPWSVDYSKFVPDLIVYCQQLKKQVVELTARVQTLETR